MVRYRAAHKGTYGSAKIVNGNNSSLIGGVCDELGAVAFHVADVHYMLGGVSVDPSLGSLRNAYKVVRRDVHTGHDTLVIATEEDTQAGDDIDS